MQEATRIILLRHGETAWNVSGRIQGHTDIALNAHGLAQAEAVALALKGEPIAAVYASDLQRAWDTACVVGQGIGQAPRPAQGLRERGFGDFEALDFPAISQRWPDEAERWRKRDPDFAPPGGGESLHTVRARVIETAQTLAARHLGEQIVLVAHGGVLDMLYRAATGQSLSAARSWKLDNAAINRLLWVPDSGFVLIGWDDVRHLDGLERDDQTL